ncbi:MAG TPA: RNA polymerase sigma factor, partial [Sphingomicrobium sp.]|nr:RNA polymerase sigma factor [Sphingomicrobium sp.]
MSSPSSFDSELAAIFPRLRRFAHALARNPADADDLAQMAAEKAFRSFDQFQAGTSFDSWIFRICRTVWIDMFRSRKRHGVHEVLPEAGEQIGFDP